MDILKLHHRLDYLLKERSITSKMLSDDTGKNPATISNYRTGITMPDSKFLISLKKFIPEYNSNWLLFGEGEPFYDQEKSSKRTKIIEENNEKVATEVTKSTVTQNSILQNRLSALEKQVNAIIVGFQEVKELASLEVMGKVKVYSYSGIVTKNVRYAA